MRPRSDMPYPGSEEPHVKVGLADIYSMLLDIDRRLAKIETHAPLTNGHARVASLETMETDHETRLRRLETAVTTNESLVRERDKNTDDTRANLALWVAGAALVSSVIVEFLSRL